MYTILATVDKLMLTAGGFCVLFTTLRNAKKVGLAENNAVQCSVDVLCCVYHSAIRAALCLLYLESRPSRE